MSSRAQAASRSAARYRRARKDFIAAVEKAGGDVVARVHPLQGPDGKPLFTDSAAFGPRDARRAWMLVGGEAAGSAALTGLLKSGIAQRLPAGARLVLVHAPDPFPFAWGEGIPDPAAQAWPACALTTICGEDIRHATRLAVLEIGGGAHFPAHALLPANTLRGARVTVQRLDSAGPARLQGAALAFLAAGL